MGCNGSKPAQGDAPAPPPKGNKVVDSGAEPAGAEETKAADPPAAKERYDRNATLEAHGYTLGRQLGKGGFGSVNYVTRNSDSRAFAVKMISKISFSSDKDLAGMALETKLMKAVRGHTNVVELVETFEDKRYYFLVMELCEGGELMLRILKHQHFSEKTASGYFRQMLLGVKHCHENLVVHRDLKPENFLFADHTEGAALKLTDFGLSTAIATPDHVITEACGSAYYIAPEVFTRRFTKACDVWSLGVILYLLLGGTVPFGFDAEEEAEVYKSIQEDEMMMTESVWSTVSASARELVHGLLEKDPVKRYTVEQALSHPWVNGESARDEPLDRNVIKSMYAFNARNKFKKEALKLIASTLSAADVQALRETFHRIDADHTGTITLQELQEAMTKADSDHEARIRDLYEELDTDGDGTVNYEEFLTATTERQLVNHQNNIWWAFCEYDRDGNGMISEAELRKIMKDIPQEQIRKYIAEFDLDKDGMINYEEFMRMVLPKDLKYKISRYN